MRTVFATLHSKFIHNSLALPCLAAYCRTLCDAVRILEFTVHEPRDMILAEILGEKPENVVFSVYLWNRRETLELVDALAVADPDLRIVLGGPEVSYDGPDLLRRHPGITALVRGEGELPLRALFEAWGDRREPQDVVRTLLRNGQELVEGPAGPPLASLDAIPSPFRAGLAALERGIVYYETGRGCPFHCSFCLSARDDRLRSYSMDRIRDDLATLIAAGVPQVKLVDRTFNYDAGRACEIFRYILAHNRSTRFHFEIAAHLLDEPTLELLDEVPEGLFQFEIGVQSTLADTLDAVNRRASLENLEKNVRRLREAGRIHLHLDLVAGLPGEDYRAFLGSLDRVAGLAPHHLQIEPVKLLPGSPLREEAAGRGIRFDPNPPYTVLGTADLQYEELLRLQKISRLLDLTYNSGCFGNFLEALTTEVGSFAAGLEELAEDWQSRGLFRFPMNRRNLFWNLWRFIEERAMGDRQHRLRDALAYDHASSERIVLNRVPAYFDTGLTAAETTWVEARVAETRASLKGEGVKLQYFAARFRDAPGCRGACVCLFLYLTRSGEGQEIEVACNRQVGRPEDHD